MPTAIPRRARDTPVASLQSCSRVSGTAEQEKDSKGPYLAVLRKRRRGTGVVVQQP